MFQVSPAGRVPSTNWAKLGEADAASIQLERKRRSGKRPDRARDGIVNVTRPRRKDEVAHIEDSISSAAVAKVL
jgi:hypothetical protein